MFSPLSLWCIVCRWVRFCFKSILNWGSDNKIWNKSRVWILSGGTVHRPAHRSAAPTLYSTNNTIQARWCRCSSLFCVCIPRGISYVSTLPYKWRNWLWGLFHTHTYSTNTIDLLAACSERGEACREERSIHLQVIDHRHSYGNNNSALKGTKHLFDKDVTWGQYLPRTLEYSVSYQPLNCKDVIYTNLWTEYHVTFWFIVDWPFLLYLGMYLFFFADTLSPSGWSNAEYVVKTFVPQSNGVYVNLVFVFVAVVHCGHVSGRRLSSTINMKVSGSMGTQNDNATVTLHIVIFCKK